MKEAPNQALPRTAPDVTAHARVTGGSAAFGLGLAAKRLYAPPWPFIPLRGLRSRAVAFRFQPMSNWIAIHSWIMAFTYPAVNITLFIAALYAARNPTFKREFLCLASAAALTVFCSTVALLFRLHLAFPRSFLSLSVRRGLLLGQNVAEVVSITIYCVGFLALARHVRSLPQATTDA
jgi:hypothetical protein